MCNLVAAYARELTPRDVSSILIQDCPLIHSEPEVADEVPLDVLISELKYDFTIETRRWWGLDVRDNVSHFHRVVYHVADQPEDTMNLQRTKALGNVLAICAFHLHLEEKRKEEYFILFHRLRQTEKFVASHLGTYLMLLLLLAQNTSFIWSAGTSAFKLLSWRDSELLIIMDRHAALFFFGNNKDDKTVLKSLKQDVLRFCRSQSTKPRVVAQALNKIFISYPLLDFSTARREAKLLVSLYPSVVSQ